jgi:hypothetical protein
MWVMPFFPDKSLRAPSLAAACAFAIIVAASFASPVLAGDDGQAPIWKGLGDLVGLTGVLGSEDKEPPIQYRERARLVLPPKMVLPPPVAPEAQKTAAWPVDPDLEKVRKAKEAARTILLSQSDTQNERDGARLSPDQLRADHSAPGKVAAADRRCSSETNKRGCDWVPFRNVFETIGLAKSDEVVAGQEPDRDWLTDPPKGYRVPTANTVATFDAKKRENQSDPRSTLYKAPEQQ